MAQNGFCKALSNAVSFRVPDLSNSLTFNPCCMFDTYIPFHPTTFKQQRKAWREATDFLPDCSKCQLKEATHGTDNSLRYITNQRIPDGIGDQIYKAEIVLDTTCNAACIQCGTLQSSLWRKLHGIDDSHMQDKSSIDRRIKQIEAAVDFDSIKIWHFWGGEPLITDTHLKIISKIKDPSSVRLHYTTNCSVFPSEDILDLWSRFQSVYVMLSVDGIDDRFNYIRWPLKWSKAAENIMFFRDKSPKNCTFGVNTCVIPLNIMHLAEVTNWFDTNWNDLSGDKNPIKVHFIRGEGQLDVACTPAPLREMVKTVYDENHPINGMLLHLPVLPSNNMISHLDHWDSRRSTNWRETFPEIQGYF